MEASSTNANGTEEFQRLSPTTTSTHQAPTQQPSPKKEMSTANARPRFLSPEATRTMCAFIKKLCKRLKLRSLTMCSALVFFHRFQDRRAQGSGGMQYDDYDLAVSCVFLACKVEENIQHLKIILDVAHALRTGDGHGHTPLSKNEEKMWKARERILLCERILLDTMAFNVTVEHAHPHAVKFIHSVLSGVLENAAADPKKSEEEEAKRHREDAKNLQQTASNILNDSLSTNMCLNYDPDLVGKAAVVLASRFLKVKAPSGNEIVNRIAAMESNGMVGGFSMSTLLPVEQELISTYEAADNTSGEKDRSSSISSTDESSSKRARLDSLE